MIFWFPVSDLFFQVRFQAPFFQAPVQEQSHASHRR